MADLNNIEALVKELKQDTVSTNSTYSAIVSQIDGQGVVWVYLAGSSTETPTASTSAEVHAGDAVTVEWRNNKLYIAGNYSSPSAGVVRVANVEQVAQGAQSAATMAYEAANSAQADADRAHAAADEAEGHAGIAQTAADNALVGLSNVEDVVGVLNWITAHGTMTANGSAALDPSKVYFIVDPNGDYEVGGTHYSIVGEPKAEDRTSYYTLSVDKSVQNYVTTHLAVNSEGLWLIPDQNGTPSSNGKKVLIATGVGSTYSTAGTYIIDKVNGVDSIIASFRADGATVGETSNGKTRTEIGTNGMRIVQRDSGADVQIANLGYDMGASTTGMARRPFYTFGTRATATDEYDPTQTYSIGDLCLHNGATYLCIEDIETPEAWDADHWDSTIIGNYSIAEGVDVIASGAGSHAEGYDVIASGIGAHAEGYGVTDGRIIASGLGAHAEGEAQNGYTIVASGTGAHAEGVAIDYNVLASGTGAHAEGTGTTASHSFAHAEGRGTTASNFGAHAEGDRTIAEGTYSHAEGSDTRATGDYAHAQNDGTVAASFAQTAIGKWNKSDSSNKYAFIIGNGTQAVPDNAFTVDWNGNVNAAGGITTKGHSSAIGTVKDAYPTSDVNVATATAKALCSISLEAGIWILLCGVRSPSNGTGVRRANIADSAASTAIGVQVGAVSGAPIQLAFTVVVQPSSTTTYYLNAMQNSGSTLAYPAGAAQSANYIRAIRIV